MGISKKEYKLMFETDAKRDQVQEVTASKVSGFVESQLVATWTYPATPQ